MDENKEIKDLLKKYKITYAEILPYVGYKHITRISEELALPLKEDRKKKYLYAIKVISQQRLKLYEE